MSELINVSGVSKCYSSKPALENIFLTLESGRITALLGPNGSGKTTLIKLLSGLLTPDYGTITINGLPVGPETKAIVSYLPDRTFIPKWMKVSDILDLFQDFYADFRREAAEGMLKRLNIDLGIKTKALSKGNLEKLHLVLVMSRNAKLYLLDEPIAGVDPAARDYILDTIITNYDPSATILMSTHLITDIERIIDDVVMIHDGRIRLHGAADDLRGQYGKSIDEIFREVFRC